MLSRSSNICSIMFQDTPKAYIVLFGSRNQPNTLAYITVDNRHNIGESVSHWQFNTDLTRTCGCYCWQFNRITSCKWNCLKDYIWLMFLWTRSSLRIQWDLQSRCRQTGSPSLQHPWSDAAGGGFCAASDWRCRGQQGHHCPLAAAGLNRKHAQTSPQSSLKNQQPLLSNCVVCVFRSRITSLCHSLSWSTVQHPGACRALDRPTLRETFTLP